MILYIFNIYIISRFACIQSLAIYPVPFMSFCLIFFSAGMVEKMERDKTNASFNGLKKCNYDEEGEKKQ